MRFLGDERASTGASGLFMSPRKCPPTSRTEPRAGQERTVAKPACARSCSACVRDLVSSGLTASWWGRDRSPAVQVCKGWSPGNPPEPGLVTTVLTCPIGDLRLQVTQFAPCLSSLTPHTYARVAGAFAGPVLQMRTRRPRREGLGRSRWQAEAGTAAPGRVGPTVPCKAADRRCGGPSTWRGSGSTERTTAQGGRGHRVSGKWPLRSLGSPSVREHKRVSR